jgi:hypothetical protein
MPVSRARAWLNAVRYTPFGARLAAALWLVLSFLVWNVVFDRVLVLAGRRYVYAAAVALNQSRSYQRIDDWMRPAVARGVWTATAAGGAILLVGLAAIWLAARRQVLSAEAPQPPRHRSTAGTAAPSR